MVEVSHYFLGRIFAAWLQMFWEKIGYSLLFCKFEKETLKKGKNCQSFETTKVEKNKTKKTLIFLWVGGAGFFFFKLFGVESGRSIDHFPLGQ